MDAQIPDDTGMSLRASEMPTFVVAMEEGRYTVSEVYALMMIWTILNFGKQHPEET